MTCHSARPAEEIENMVQTYGDMLFRISIVILRNKYDAEDAIQETVLKYIQKAPSFESADHEKAWLIRVVTNQCRDIQRFQLRHPSVCIEDLDICISHPESCGIIEALMSIPQKFKIVLLLYYMEDYSIKEIASIIKKSPSAVKMRLQKGRKLLEKKYRKEYM